MKFFVRHDMFLLSDSVRVCMDECLFVCLCVYSCENMHVYYCMWVNEREREKRGWERECMNMCVHACGGLCVRVCIHAGAHVCTCVCVCMRTCV